MPSYQRSSRMRSLTDPEIASTIHNGKGRMPAFASITDQQTFSQASVWGVTQPACIVSGDLYDFLSFTDSEVGLICADVSGKGTSAALTMANLQALAQRRLLLFDSANVRPAPDAFVTALNRDISGRFGDSRHATLFYGEFD